MAATDLERLVVQLSADITKYEKSMNRALGITNTNVKKMQATASAGAGGIEKAFTSLGAKVAGVFGVIEGAKAFVNFSDSATKISNSLKTAGLAGDDLKKVYNELFVVANKNGAPVEALAQLYSRVAVVQKELGVSSEQLVGLTDNVGKSLKITGVSAAEASGTLLQLAQAFGGNKIQAQEYNSLIDGALPLLKAAAAGIKEAGGSVAALTLLVKSGQVSNKAFFDGIEAGSFTLDKALGGATQTVGQAMENLNTSLIKAAGNFNDQTGASTALAHGIQAIADAATNIKFDSVIAEVNAITSAINSAIGAAAGLLQKLGDLGKASGAVDYAASLPTNDMNSIMLQLDKNAQGPTSDSKLSDLANQRLSVEQKIADIRAQGLDTLDAGKGALDNYSADLANIDKQVSSIKDSVTSTKDAAVLPKTAQPARPFSPTPAAGNKPIDDSRAGSVSIKDPKYAVAPTKKTGGGSKADPYENQLASITKRTDAIEAETAAQAKLNPLIDDYGYAVNKAKQQSLLETAAIKKNGEVTAAQAAEIDKVSSAYAAAEAAAAKLDEQQKKIKETQTEIQATAQDVTRGIVDGFIAGESAAKVFSDALGKIANKLLDMAFNDLFTSSSKGGAGLGDLISKIFGYSEGGYTGAGSKYTPAGIVHKGEYVVPKSTVDKLGVSGLEKRLAGYANGGLVGAPRLPSLSPASSGGGDTFTYAPVIDARGADTNAIAALRQAMENDRKQFAAKTIETVRKAKQSNVKGI
jgi:tape measure domain-containing protein